MVSCLWGHGIRGLGLRQVAGVGMRQAAKQSWPTHFPADPELPGAVFSRSSVGLAP